MGFDLTSSSARNIQTDTSFPVSSGTVPDIPYNLMEGYPEFRIEEDGAKATEKYVMLSSNFQAFYQISLPGSESIAGFVNRLERRRLPGNDKFLTKEIRGKPFVGDKPGDPYGIFTSLPSATHDSHYLVTIEYDTLREEGDETDPVTFLEHSVSASAEFLSISPKKTDYANRLPGEPLPSQAALTENRNQLQPIIKVIPQMQHSFSWRFVIQPNWQSIMDNLGKVNAEADDTGTISAKDGMFFGAEAETVMFMGVTGSQKNVFEATGRVLKPWELAYLFLMKRVVEDGNVYGWNHVWDPEAAAWVTLVRAGGQMMHETTDFADLWQAP